MRLNNWLISLVCFIYIPVLCWSCRSVNNNTDHPKYFDSVFHRMDSLYADNQVLRMRFLDSVYAQFPTPGPLDLFRKYEQKARYSFTQTRDYNKAVLYVDSELYVLQNEHIQKLHSKEYADCLLVKGDLLRVQGKYTDAWLYYYKAKEAILKTRDSCQFSEFDMRFGAVYYKQEKYREAIPYFEKAFFEVGLCADDPIYIFYTQQRILDNIGLCYEHASVQDSAIYYYDSALHYIAIKKGKIIQNPHRLAAIQTAIGIIKGNKGGVLALQGKTKEAESLLNESIHINEDEKHERSDAEYSMVKLAKIYIAENRLKDALSVLERVRLSLSEVVNKDAEMQYWQVLSKYYYQTSQLPAAYTAIQRYQSLKDSLNILNTQTVDINREFEHISREYELSKLKKRDELKTLYLTVALILIVLIGLIVYLVSRAWIQSHKNIKRLTTLNQRIKSQNEEMRMVVNSLEESQNDQGRIMKTIAHDLKSPLHGVMGISSLLLDEQAIPEEYRNMVELMKVTASNSLEMISDLLHMSISSDKLRMELVDMGGLLQHSINLLQFKAKEKGQTLTLLIAENILLTVDTDKIWRVINNLLMNAIKFSAEGSVTQVELKVQDETVVVSVKDNGIGIPDKLKAHIFEVFSNARRQGTANEPSFGLGLSISKQIVEAHNGHIWFESETGKGTTFYVALPFKKE